jgi:hypothetical protein
MPKHQREGVDAAHRVSSVLATGIVISANLESEMNPMGGKQIRMVGGFRPDECKAHAQYPQSVCCSRRL